MSARFGHDFSNVRVHTDACAGDSAAALGASAYAVGSDIMFGAGKYAPTSSDGERLLARELTHVVQQAQFGDARDPSGLSRRGDAAEREAASLSSQVMMGQSVQVNAAPAAGIHRYQAPDQEWADKRDADSGLRDVRIAEAIPGYGNLFSAGLGGLSLGAAGYDVLTGDRKGAANDMKSAEDAALNVIPWYGNYRAAKQALHDDAAVNLDDRGMPPEKNLNSGQEWQKPGGSANKLNGGISQVWNALWD